MNCESKICVCGHFGVGQTLLNGQTVKTKIVTREIEKKFGSNAVYEVDTHGGVKVFPRVIFGLLKGLLKCNSIVVFLSDNGLRFIVPILWFLSLMVRNRHFYYVVIGGYIQDYLPKHKFVAWILRKYEAIYVETLPMKNAMKELGFGNVVIMPNCKELEICDNPRILQTPPFPLCTFSRVMKTKGIEDAVKAVISVNERAGDIICFLDIYGQIELNEEMWFDELMKSAPEYIRYRGLVPFTESVKVLSNYYALLFPTYYEGEGFAGTLIDAFAAGIPIIASDWRYNCSIIDDGRTGTIFPSQSIEGLSCAIVEACSNPTKWNEKKKQCLEEAKKYQPDVVVEPLINALMLYICL